MRGRSGGDRVKSSLSFVRRSQRLLRAVSELHRLGYQRLRVMPYEYPLAWRCVIAPADRFHPRNGAYVEDLGEGEIAHYSSASENEYFGWTDAKQDDARALAEKLVARFPAVVAAGAGRDWAYAGWLAELLGALERGPRLPFVMAEYFEPGPTELRALPIRDFEDGLVRMDFPLPPPVEAAD
jgi:hypothetical protein